MTTNENFDKKFKFLLDSKMSSFLFIKISLHADWVHILQLAKMDKNDVDVVLLQDNDDILDVISRNHADRVLICVDPCSTTLLHRLNYVRDSLHMIGKMLIFVFYTAQYEEVLIKYQDFAAYASIFLNCASEISVPFSPLFSCDMLNDQSQKQLSAYLDVLRAHKLGDSYAISEIQKSIEKLKHIKMNAIEIARLDEQIENLYILNDFSFVITNNQNTDTFLNLKRYYEVIVEVVLDYIATLVAKERIYLALNNLLKLYAFILKNEFKIDNGLLDISIDSIESFCRSVASDDTNFYRNIVKNWTNSIIKILISYYLQNSSEASIETAIKLNAFRYSLSRSIKFNNNDMAQYISDYAMLLFLKNGNPTACLTIIKDIKTLEIDYATLFLYYYNKTVFLLSNSDYDKALLMCDEFLDKKEALAYKDDIFTFKILVLRHWILGIYYRKLSDMVRLNCYILKHYREIFSENHHNLAELYYCNAVMSREIKDSVESHYYAYAAHNILKDSKNAKVRNLKQLVESLMESK